jgi:AmmeMemoRadiSam system protein A
LSHRLKPEAPAGYNPRAHLFDELVVEALRSDAAERIIEIDPDLRKLAGECGYRSLLVALGATQDSPRSCEVLSYEAPFGVGYLVAQLSFVRAAGAPGLGKAARKDADQDEGVVNDDQLVAALARKAVETFVLTNALIKPPRQPVGLLAERAACFVSIKTRSGDLRGCVGTVQPAQETLAQELILNAIHAASRDPRFQTISAAELPHLSYSVDVLSAPEPATFAELDPKNFGVIVEDDAGRHRGLLLPDLEGVDTAAKQVEIAARKGGIPAGVPVRLSRFRVQRFREV